MLVRPRTICTLLAAGLLAGLAGCLQVDTQIALAPDGSATITERIQFSKQLLDLADSAATTVRSASSQPDGADLRSMLEKPAVQERMKRMGKGVTLVSHAVRDGLGASRESVAVFHIDDIRELRYGSPFLAFIDYPANNVIKADMFPVYESTWYGRRAGQMAVTFSLLKEGKQAPRPKEGEPPPPGPSPISVQMLRYLQPMARDMLSGLKVKVAFVSFSPLRFRQYFRYRNQAAGTHEFDLIDWSDKDLDQFNMNLLDNEEVMLELVNGSFGSKNFLEATKEHGTNLTLPVYHPTGIPEIYFNPSRKFFDQYFTGKSLKFDVHEGGERAANFDEIGYKASEEGKAPVQPAVSTSRPDDGGRATSRPDGSTGRPSTGGRPPRTPRTPRTPATPPAGTTQPASKD